MILHTMKKKIGVLNLFLEIKIGKLFSIRSLVDLFAIYFLYFTYQSCHHFISNHSPCSAMLG